MLSSYLEVMFSSTVKFLDEDVKVEIYPVAYEILSIW